MSKLSRISMTVIIVISFSLFYTISCAGDGGNNEETITNGGLNPDDPDADGILTSAGDNCPITWNPLQTNSDTDIWGDACDNCPSVDNNDQANADGDMFGDACDVGITSYIRIEGTFASSTTSWIMYGDCFTDPNPPDAWPEMGDGNGLGIAAQGTISPNALITSSCMFSINLTPAITNSCGSTFWLPCQDGSGNIIGLPSQNSGLTTLNAYISLTGLAVDEVQVPIIVIPNAQNGGNFILDLSGIILPGGDPIVIIGIPIDTDGDTILNPFDNCILVANPGQEANAGNPTYMDPFGILRLVGNACIGIDDNNDGLPNPP